MFRLSTFSHPDFGTFLLAHQIRTSRRWETFGLFSCFSLLFLLSLLFVAAFGSAAKANSGLGRTQVDFSFDCSLPKKATSWKTLLKLLLSCTSILFLWIPQCDITKAEPRLLGAWLCVFLDASPDGGHRLGGIVSNAICFASCNSRYDSLHFKKFLLVDRPRAHPWADDTWTGLSYATRPGARTYDPQGHQARNEWGSWLFILLLLFYMFFPKRYYDSST